MKQSAPPDMLMHPQGPLDAPSPPAAPIGGGLNAIRYVMSVAHKVGTRQLAAAVQSRNTCKACAFGTGGQRGGLHNEHNPGIEICNKNTQAQSSDIRSGIRAGNLMCYFPEGNVLVPQTVDPRSRTPAFKSVPVSVQRSASAGPE